MSGSDETRVSWIDGLPTKDEPVASPTAMVSSPTATVFPDEGSDKEQRGRQDTVSTFMGSTRVPPDHKHHRTLILCFDGTGDQFDADNSNIVEFFTLLHKGDPEKQMVYYQAGIGTYISAKTATPFFARISKSLDEAIAWHLDAHIMDGYEFLMQNYRAGDRICIFGFSRGAYTARCLAGMIHKIGLLPACNHQQVPFAYKMYKHDDAFGWKQSNAFKKAFSIDVDIEFLGVWDTVDSVGIIPRRLPFSMSNTIVRTFRHAIALDERRAKFKPSYWARLSHKESHMSYTDQAIERRQKREEARRKKENKSSKDGHNEKNCLVALENRYSTMKNTPTDAEEVWFAGCHCDVGGGSVSNETKINLARIPLRWMVRECFKRETGILFQVEGLRSIGLDPATLYPVVLPRPPPLSATAADLRIQRRNKPPAIITDPDAIEEMNDSDSDNYLLSMTEEEHELHDALAPKYDQLKLSSSWWMFEYLPMKFRRYTEGEEGWKMKWGINKAEGRRIPRQESEGVKVHRSVKIRMETVYENGKKYFPKANLNLEKVIWVD